MVTRRQRPLPVYLWLIAAAAGVYGLSLLGTAIAPVPEEVASNPADHTDPVASPSPFTGTSHRVDATSGRGSYAKPLCGFAISLHHTDHFPLYLEAIDEIAAMGFDSVEVLTPVFQTNGASQEIRIETGPGRGPPRWQVVALLQHARDRGLTTALMPVVLFTQPKGNEWRGKIHPDRWDPWWASYRRMIDYFLDIANEAGVDVFCVGSELLSTERQVNRWRHLIAHARLRYRGRLTYSANWDHYHVPTLWRDLDMIGISGYWDITTLTDVKNPQPDALIHRWRQIREQILAFAHAQQRPVLLTELGYPSLPWALQRPWHYVNPDAVPADPRAQAMGYDAFLAAWSRALRPEQRDHERDDTNTSTSRPPHDDPLAGVFFYAWDPYAAGGPTDTGYGARGKPAMDRLRTFLSERDPSPAVRDQ